MFQIIGAMAEFERASIQERVRAGLRNARLKGKRLGRLSKALDSGKILKLPEAGVSWRAISKQFGAGLQLWSGQLGGLFARALRLRVPKRNTEVPKFLSINIQH
jgi:hypothetical protein